MKTDQKDVHFDMNSCMEMMKKMMSQVEAGCDCGMMRFRFAERPEIPDEWLEIMSKMGSCCGIKEQEDPAA